MRTSAWTVGVAVAATLSLAVAACGGGKSSSDKGTTPAKTGSSSTAGKPGGKLTVLAVGDIQHSDCGQAYYQYDYFFCYATQRPLYSYKPDDGEHMVPDLASAPPQVSADGKTVTVKIRSGVKFSPPVNRAATSKDVKYAIERMFFNTVQTGYATLYFNDIKGAKAGVKPGTTISGIETPDDQTIVFHLTKPTAGVLAAGALALPGTAPVPEEWAKKFDAKTPTTYGENQVATGPYMVKNNAAGKSIGWQPGKSLDLVRNPNWDKSTDLQARLPRRDPGAFGQRRHDCRLAPDPERPEHDQRRLEPGAVDAQGGEHQQQEPARARPERDDPLRGHQHDGQAVRQRQPAQGDLRRDGPQRAAARARRPADRRHGHPLPAARHQRLRAGGWRQRPRRRLPQRDRRAESHARGGLHEEGGLPLRQVHRERLGADGRQQRGHGGKCLGDRQGELREARLQGHAAPRDDARHVRQVLPESRPRRSPSAPTWPGARTSPTARRCSTRSTTATTSSRWPTTTSRS